MASEFSIEMFYDGDCPVCRRETRLLKKLDRHSRIRFTDIAAPDFRTESPGRTLGELMAEIHGRLPDGTWITGVEVFRRLYSCVGFGPLVLLTRLPLIRNLLDLGYRIFAANRLRLTGRCDATCPLPPAEPIDTRPPLAKMK